MDVGANTTRDLPNLNDGWSIKQRILFDPRRIWDTFHIKAHESVPTPRYIVGEPPLYHCCRIGIHSLQWSTDGRQAALTVGIVPLSERWREHLGCKSVGAGVWLCEIFWGRRHLAHIERRHKVSGRKQFLAEGGSRMPMRLLSLTILSAGCPASKASPRVPLHLVLTSIFYMYLLTTNITIIGRISIPTRSAFSSAGGQPLSRRREGVDAAAVIRQQRYDGEGRQGNQPPLHLASIRRAITINQLWHVMCCKFFNFQLQLLKFASF